jgi:hypothetical protein
MTLGRAPPKSPRLKALFNPAWASAAFRDAGRRADLRDKIAGGIISCYANRRAGSTNMSDRRELYRSPNGDTWFLGREPANGHAFIIHQPDAPSGGRLSHIELGAFLREAAGPEQQALLRLIGTLVEVPPYADRI